jgi:MYXO-CTERM domain-containing protein
MSMAHARRGWRFAAVGLALALATAACGNANPGREAVGSSSSAITFPNDEPAYDYFVGKGLTSFQAAGIVGNLDQESGVDPTAVQPCGPGRGIAQWSVGGRWDTDAGDNATWYAGTEGMSVLSLQLQLDFIWFELTTFPGYGLAALQATTNVTDATIAFETDFEGCGDCDQSQRIAYAENVLAAFGASPVDAGSGTDAGAETPCFVTTTGESGVCIDTSECTAMGGTSTPDYCPGPDDIQCCTGIETATHDAGPTPKKDAGGPPRDARDAAADVATSRTPGQSHDGTTVPDPSDVPSGGSGGGCSMSPASSAGSRGAVWLVGFALLFRRRRRR